MAVSFPSKGLTREAEIEFVKALCIKIYKQKKYTGQSYKTYQNDGTTISLPFWYGNLFARKYELSTIGGPYPEMGFEFTGELRDYQVAGLEQVREHLAEHFTSTVSFHPGAGKTVIGSAIAYMCNVRTLVTHHRTPLRKQWTGTIEAFTTAKVYIVGYKKNKIAIEDANIIICMAGQYDKIPLDIRMSIGLLLIDEAHCYCTKERSESLLKFIRPMYVVALTATPFRSDKQSDFLISLVGPHQIVRPFKKEFLVKCRRTKIIPEQVSHPVTGNLDWSVYTKSLMKSETRNEMIVKDVLSHLDRKILILTIEVSHVEVLSTLLSPHVQVATMMGNQKTYTDSPVLIGTCSKISVGFDVATNADDYDGRPIDLVIMCTSFADENVICQSAGRGLRAENPLFIYYLDDAPVARTHWKTFSKWAQNCLGRIEYEKD